LANVTVGIFGMALGSAVGVIGITWYPLYNYGIYGYIMLYNPEHELKQVGKWDLLMPGTG
jgi:hypothetical protein